MALDRQEVGTKAGSTQSAAQEGNQNTGIPVIAVATLADITAYLAQHPDANTEHRVKLNAIEAYRKQYGAVI